MPDTVSLQIKNLRELIAALDRRVPRLEDTGELDIARDAAALRSAAVQRMMKLTAAESA
jgi:hypothetical protein